VKIREKTKVGEYLVADSIEAVVSLAQMGIVEIHTWNSTAEDLERPNRIVWDLDPGPDVTWKQVTNAAGVVREVLKTLGLICAFSPRARPGAMVSMPLDWSDLTASPERWTLTTVPKRLKRLRADPWAKYWTAAQAISDASFAAVRGL